MSASHAHDPSVTARAPDETQFADMQELHAASGYYGATAPVPLVASAVSLPSAAGTASLGDLLPPAIRDRYLDPATLLRRPCEMIAPAAAVPVRDQHEYEKLIRRMLEAGMLRFTRNPMVVNGIFVVPKDDGKLRLIIDARRCNVIFSEPPSVDLPTPDLLAKLTAPVGTPFYVAGDDADNFYHRLRLPEAWVPYFALPPVSATAVGVDAEWGDVMVHPCCLTLPMGFAHSVYLAQQVHEHLVYTRTSLRRGDRISRHTDLKLDRLRHSIYIDDLGLFGFDPGGMRAVQSEYAAAMASVGLPTKPSKHVDPSCDGVKVLGVIVHGRLGTVGLDVASLHSLVALTREFIAARVVTGDALARLVGRWTWAALPARPMLSIFSSVYRYIELIGRRRGVIWPSVVRELSTIATLAPLMFAVITAPWLSHVCAVDASGQGEGVACQQVSSPVATELSAGAGLVPAPVTSATTRVIGGRWRKVLSSAWRDHREHINVLECRAALAAVRWSLRLPRAPHRSRLVIMSDSAVVTYALTKGRSSSRPLLSRIRAISALLLGSGTHLYTHWLPSAQNPADALSRLQRLHRA